VTLLAAIGNVNTNTGALPIVMPPATISVSQITEILGETVNDAQIDAEGVHA
jgi:glycine betaine/proline transport system ATP-binding protein